MQMCEETSSVFHFHFQDLSFIPNTMKCCVEKELIEKCMYVYIYIEVLYSYMYKQWSFWFFG
jgi:hypothetical protein